MVTHVSVHQITSAMNGGGRSRCLVVLFPLSCSRGASPASRRPCGSRPYRRELTPRSPGYKLHVGRCDPRLHSSCAAVPILLP
ncbi:hypothetical protein CC85DRAFT_105714 [Cutaneotrichosporon oleaginosum]|uniref:Uncharacterized protein n=1 Tax=Cutaneotrichosporon oleaginosum TaxID=879819 RepID=A0A0J0XLA9_9TREE|nr:uncharacterized protein CC85DRAFT_105714 [Cutaneotrichosporon oleaginosum]KLT41872.1 hypothetical protein CC85DRAFT_105714 [Cutaneotrichosporon oleaginosum]TXT14790.1 hypothetical protein COLE_00983 [Cutaneotrichosporon oleaginosum]